MLPVTPVQNAEGGWCSASRGVTAEDLWVRHGMIGWETSWWTKRVKWVPTFKVECSRLGYVDDLTGWTHGRNNNGRIPKSCLGYSTQTKKQECGIFQVDLQDKTCCWLKARFVTKGFSQKEGIDYEETFAPRARYTSIRTIIALASMMKWDLHQMDVKRTFLDGMIEEEVYIEQPQGF